MELAKIFDSSEFKSRRFRIKTLEDHLRFFVVLTFIFFSQFLAAQTYSGNQNDIDQILANIKAFSNAYMNLDYEAIANSYTEDGIILPPGGDIITGRAAIKKRWTLPEGVKIPLHKITPTEITIIGDIAHDIGYYEGRTLKKDGTEVSWKGKYLIIWKKINGDWKIYADAWNRID
jgi:ketosteroid isomerase-like protein